MGDAIEAVETMIAEADAKRASDIHIDADERGSSVRFRIDGELRHSRTLPSSLHADVIGRLRILSGLRTDEHAVPQDGRFRVASAAATLDVRLAITPSYFGESATLRLLRPTSTPSSLADLGMRESDAAKVAATVRSMSGMVVVTGPTGSGKTTTLYTILSSLDRVSNSVITIEDPIEYGIPGIRQVQTNAARGLSFAAALRSVLRQDPDAIMVGEIRDAETARIAVHAALTGHLLLTTLHTTDAATAIPRLIDMGIDPYLVASLPGAVVGQRLVRSLCRCGGSCELCGGTGYAGRTGIFETIELDEPVRALALRRAPAGEIAAAAFPRGFGSMEDDGLAKVEQGLTSLEEVSAALSD